MIWWRGNGIWALTLVALIVFSAGRAIGTSFGVPLGLASAAVLVFVTGPIWDKEASAFSIPVRYWPIVLLIVAALAFFDSRSKAKLHPQDDMTKVLAEIEGSLPYMVGDNIRAEQVTYKDKTLRYDAKALAWFDSPSAESSVFERLALKKYCDTDKLLLQRKISVEYAVKIPPRSLNDRVQNYAFTLSPASCNAG